MSNARPSFRQVLPAGTLLATCLVLHIAAMWPNYPGLSGHNVVSSPSETTIYVFFEVGWALAALLVLSRTSLRGAVALAAGLGLVELGLLVSDLATSLQGSGSGTPGVLLALVGLGAGAAGAGAGAVTLRRSAPEPVTLRQRLTPEHLPRIVLTVVAALVAVVAYLPSWDRISAVAPAIKWSTSALLGNAFDQPGGVMAGQLEAAAAIALVPILSAFWADLDVAAWAMAGALLALGSQLVSALVQADQGLSPALFGFTSNEARTYGLRSSFSLTGWWTIDVAAAVALGALALLAAADRGLAGTESSAAPQSAPAPPERWPPAHHWPGG